MKPLSFSVSDRVREIGVRGVYLRASGLTNRRTDEAFETLLVSSMSKICQVLTPDYIEAHPVLAGFRRLHDAVGRSNKKNVSSPENLCRLLQERGMMPRINLVVDIYNLVSLETMLALGAHDVTGISGDVSLRLTEGNESFIPLGSHANKGVSAGEYAYVDDAGDVLCRLEVRQVEKTKVVESTTDCFYIIQGNLATPPALLDEAAQRVEDLTTQFCGGAFETLARVC